MALTKASWDYLVAVTEKPNPNWLNQKGILFIYFFLTLKLFKKGWLASNRTLFRALAYQ